MISVQNILKLSKQFSNFLDHREQQMLVFDRNIDIYVPKTTTSKRCIERINGLDIFEDLLEPVNNICVYLI